jgi:hypothetical protein
LDLHFPLSGPREHEGQCCAYLGDPLAPAAHFWSRIAFDSTSVQVAFPARGHIPAEASPMLASVNSANPPPDALTPTSIRKALRRNVPALRAWLEAHYRETSARATKKQVEAKARESGWPVRWARDAYAAICDELEQPERRPGRPTA